MSEEEEFKRLQKKYSGLKYEKGWWKRAWEAICQGGKKALIAIGAELNKIWNRGGRELVTIATLLSIVAVFIPVALPAAEAAVIVMVPRIFNGIKFTAA